MPEVSIKDAIDGIMTQSIHLSLVLIGCNEEISFLHSLPAEINAIELFSDEWVACISENSKFSNLTEIDSSDNSVSFVQYLTTYYNYFGMNIEENSTVKSNNTALHLKMMRDNNMVSITMKKIANKMYPQNDIVFKPLKTRTFCKAYLLKNKLSKDKHLEKV